MSRNYLGSMSTKPITSLYHHRGHVTNNLGLGIWSKAEAEGPRPKPGVPYASRISMTCLISILFLMSSGSEQICVEALE